MSWFDDNADAYYEYYGEAPQPLSPAEQTYANQTGAREAYYRANPDKDPTKTFTQNERTGLGQILDRDWALNPPEAPRAADTPAGGGGGGADAASIIAQWQQTHSPNEPLSGLIAELKSKGINADAFMYGSTPSGNEISLNGKQYKVKTGDNRAWWDPSMGEGPSGDDGAPKVGPYTAPFTEPFSYSEFAAPDKFVGATFTAPTDVTEQNDPGYIARMKAGEQALQRSAAAKGTLLTGGTVKDLNQYAQDYASNEYGNVYNRAYNEYATKYGTAWDEYKQNYNNKFSEWGAGYNKALGEYQQRYGIYDANQRNQFDRTYSLMQLGLQGAQGQAQAGQGYASQYGNYLNNYGSNLSDIYTNQGNANAAAQVASGNAYGSAFGNMANSALYYGSMYGRNAPVASRPSGLIDYNPTGPLGPYHPGVY